MNRIYKNTTVSARIEFEEKRAFKDLATSKDMTESDLLKSLIACLIASNGQCPRTCVNSNCTECKLKASLTSVKTAEAELGSVYTRSQPKSEGKTTDDSELTLARCFT